MSSDAAGPKIVPSRPSLLPKILIALTKIGCPRNSFDCVASCAVRSMRWDLGCLPCWTRSPHYSASSAPVSFSPTPSTATGRADRPLPVRSPQWRPGGSFGSLWAIHQISRNDPRKGVDQARQTRLAPRTFRRRWAFKMPTGRRDPLARPDQRRTEPACGSPSSAPAISA
jgi:hypothetical protein